MSQFIKFFNKIEPLLNDEQKRSLENYAYQYAKFWRVYFKILKAEDNELIIRVEQHKKPTKTPYFTTKELNENAKELFSKYFPWYTIHTNPVPYELPPADVVTPEWLREQMQAHHIGAKKVSKAVGIPQSEFSALLNGHREMGIRTKGLFYYYFAFLQLRQKYENKNIFEKI